MIEFLRENADVAIPWAIFLLAAGWLTYLLITGSALLAIAFSMWKDSRDERTRAVRREHHHER